MPTEVLPKQTVPRKLELAFNLNVALLGMIAEYKTQQEHTNTMQGPIATRQQAKAAAEEARRDMWEWEQEQRRSRRMRSA